MPDAPARIADDELRRIAATGDPVAAIHRNIVDHAVRLHIPLKDVVHLRGIAKALRVLASTLEILCDSKDETWRILWRAKTAIKEFNMVVNDRVR